MVNKKEAAQEILVQKQPSEKFVPETQDEIARGTNVESINTKSS